MLQKPESGRSNTFSFICVCGFYMLMDYLKIISKWKTCRGIATVNARSHFYVVGLSISLNTPENRKPEIFWWLLGVYRMRIVAWNGLKLLILSILKQTWRATSAFSENTPFSFQLDARYSFYDTSNHSV